jgi:hypothetical protein
MWTLLRLNMLTFISAFATGNAWSYYYFTPLASFWTVVVTLPLLLLSPRAAAVLIFSVCHPIQNNFADLNDAVK